MILTIESDCEHRSAPGAAMCEVCACILCPQCANAHSKRLKHFNFLSSKSYDAPRIEDTRRQLQKGLEHAARLNVLLMDPPKPNDKVLGEGSSELERFCNALKELARTGFLSSAMEEAKEIRGQDAVWWQDLGNAARASRLAGAMGNLELLLGLAGPGTVLGEKLRLANIRMEEQLIESGNTRILYDKMKDECKQGRATMDQQETEMKKVKDLIADMGQKAEAAKRDLSTKTQDMDRKMKERLQKLEEDFRMEKERLAQELVAYKKLIDDQKHELDMELAKVADELRMVTTKRQNLDQSRKVLKINIKDLAKRRQEAENEVQRLSSQLGDFDAKKLAYDELVSKIEASRNTLLGLEQKATIQASIEEKANVAETKFSEKTDALKRLKAKVEQISREKETLVMQTVELQLTKDLNADAFLDEQALTARISVLDSEAKKKDELAERARREWKEFDERRKKDVGEMEKRLAEAQNKLEETIVQMNEKVKKLALEINNKKEELAKLTSNLGKGNDAFEKLKANFMETNKNLNEAKAKLAETDANLKKKANENATLEKRINEQKENQALLATNISTKQDELKQLEKQLSDLKVNCSEWEKGEELQRKTFEETKAREEKLIAELKEKARHGSGECAKLAKVQGEIQARKEENARLASEIEEKETTVATLRKQKNELDGYTAKIRGMREGLGKLIERYKKGFVTASDKVLKRIADAARKTEGLGDKMVRCAGVMDPKIKLAKKGHNMRQNLKDIKRKGMALIAEKMQVEQQILYIKKCFGEIGKQFKESAPKMLEIAKKNTAKINAGRARMWVSCGYIDKSKGDPVHYIKVDQVTATFMLNFCQHQGIDYLASLKFISFGYIGKDLPLKATIISNKRLLTLDLSGNQFEKGFARDLFTALGPGHGLKCLILDKVTFYGAEEATQVIGNTIPYTKIEHLSLKGTTTDGILNYILSDTDALKKSKLKYIYVVDGVLPAALHNDEEGYGKYLMTLVENYGMNHINVTVPHSWSWKSPTYEYTRPGFIDHNCA